MSLLIIKIIRIWIICKSPVISFAINSEIGCQLIKISNYIINKKTIKCLSVYIYTFIHKVNGTANDYGEKYTKKGKSIIKQWVRKNKNRMLIKQKEIFVLIDD